MKTIISKYFKLSAITVFIATSVYADAPKKEKSSDDNLKVTLQVDKNGTKNSKLKEGKACNFDDLEEAKGEEFSEIPMAQTIPCADVDCKKLKPAVLHKDNYKDLPETKTIKGCD